MILFPKKKNKVPNGFAIFTPLYTTPMLALKIDWNPPDGLDLGHWLLTDDGAGGSAKPRQPARLHVSDEGVQAQLADHGLARAQQRGAAGRVAAAAGRRTGRAGARAAAGRVRPPRALSL